MTSSVQAGLGPISSGGGLGVMCNDDNGNMVYEVLDYYEAKIKFGEQALLSKTGDWYEDSYNLARNIYRLQGVENFQDIITNFDIVDHNINSLMSIVEWVEDLPLINDAGDMIEVPDNCKIIQIATFYDRKQRLKINKKYWDELDSLNKAVLFNHEIRYYFERKESEYDSRTTRSFVQQALTAKHQVPVLDNIDDASLICKSLENKNTPFNSYEFYMYVHKLNGKTILQFKNFDNRGLFVKTTATFNFDFNVVNRLDPKLGLVTFPEQENINLIKTSSVVGNSAIQQNVKIEFISGKAITVQSFKSGIATSRKLKLGCSEY